MRLKRTALRSLVLVGALELLYLIAANGFLNTSLFNKVVNGDPVSVSIHFDQAWTIVPGLVQVKNISVGGQDHDILWKVVLDKAQVWVNMPALFNRKFQALRVAADGGYFNLVAHQPIPPKTVKHHSPRGPFKIEISGIDLKNFNLIHLDQYEYQGPARIEGSFFLWPGRQLTIYNSFLDFKEGTVSFHDKILASAFSGNIVSAIHNWQPKQDPAKVLFDKLDSKVTLAGDITDASFLQYYLKSISWLKIRSATGNFRVAANIKSGELTQNSTANITATNLDASLGKFKAQGAGKIAWQVKDQILAMNLEIANYSAQTLDTNHRFMTGKTLSLKTQTEGLRFSEIFSDSSKVSASLSIPQAQVTDLSFINVFMPTSDFKIIKGMATLDALLNVSTSQKSKSGFVKVNSPKVRGLFLHKPVEAAVTFDTQITDDSMNVDSFSISQSSLKFSVASSDPSLGIKPGVAWNGEVNIDHAHLKPMSKKVLSGNSKMSLDDAQPILAILGPRSLAARLINQFAEIKDIKGSNHFTIGPGLVDISNIQIDSSDLDIEAQVKLLENKKQILALAKFGILQVGIDIDNGKSSTKVLGAREWIQDRPGWPKPAKSSKVEQPTFEAKLF